MLQFLGLGGNAVKTTSLTKRSSVDNIVQLAKAMAHPLTGVPIRDRVYRAKKYKKCFIAKEAVDWCLINLPMRTRDEAVMLCNR